MMKHNMKKSVKMVGEMKVHKMYSGKKDSKIMDVKMKTMEGMHDHSDVSVEELELTSWKHKLIGAWTFTLPAAVIMFSERLFGFSFVPEWMVIPLLLILGFPVVFVLQNQKYTSSVYVVVAFNKMICVTCVVSR